MSLLACVRRAVKAFSEEPSTAPVPDRIATEVRAFRVMYPEATSDEWEGFAISQARRSFQEGWAKGVAAREEDDPLPWTSPDVPEMHPYAQRVLSLGYDPGNPLGRATEEERAELHRVLLRGWTLPGEMSVTLGEDGNTSSREDQHHPEHEQRSKDPGTSSE